jgi:hypothetical protein
VNRKLAEQLFQERLQELKDLIAAEEATFQYVHPGSASNPFSPPCMQRKDP